MCPILKKQLTDFTISIIIWLEEIVLSRRAVWILVIKNSTVSHISSRQEQHCVRVECLLVCGYLAVLLTFDLFVFLCRSLRDGCVGLWRQDCQSPSDNVIVESNKWLVVAATPVPARSLGSTALHSAVLLSHHRSRARRWAPDRLLRCILTAWLLCWPQLLRSVDLKRLLELLSNAEPLQYLKLATWILSETVKNFNFELPSLTIVDRAGKFVLDFPLSCWNLLHCA